MATPMNRMLFPWIVGSFFIVDGIPTVLALDPPTAPQVAAPSDRAAANFRTAPGAAPVPAAAKPSEPPLPTGQVWQCTVDGQKTFSDKRCGAGASIRQLNEVNRMEPTPESAIHFYRSPPTGTYSPDTGYAPAADERGSPDTADEIYSTPPVIVVNRRPGHRPVPRPHPHPHAQAHK